MLNRSTGDEKFRDGLLVLVFSGVFAGRCRYVLLVHLSSAGAARAREYKRRAIVVTTRSDKARSRTTPTEGSNATLKGRRCKSRYGDARGDAPILNASDLPALRCGGHARFEAESQSCDVIAMCGVVLLSVAGNVVNNCSGPSVINKGVRIGPAARKFKCAKVRTKQKLSNVSSAYSPCIISGVIASVAIHVFHNQIAGWRCV